MRTYNWEYGVEPNNLVRIFSRIEALSDFSGESAQRRIVFWMVRKDSYLETDGKVIYNKDTGEDGRYGKVIFFYVYKNSTEGEFIDCLNDDLLVKYLKVFCENAAYGVDYGEYDIFIGDSHNVRRLEVKFEWF